MNNDFREKKIEVIEEYILNNFHYDSTSGVITRKDRFGGCGSLDKYGYLIIKIKGVQIKAHRLCWFLFYKKWPDFNIDHINRNKTDNRICNLRDVTQSINNINKDAKINKKTGLKRITRDDKTKGLVSIFGVRIKNKTYRFKTIEEAIKKRDEYYGEEV